MPAGMQMTLNPLKAIRQGSKRVQGQLEVNDRQDL